jgi:hypothetical protein
LADARQLGFWLWGLLAVAIALLLSSIELLTKYQARSPREIFGSRYYAAFAALNSTLCFLVYCLLPHFKDVVKSTLWDEAWFRSVAAGLGYLVIARTSILDIKTKTGEPVGVGLDVIYSGLAQYILNWHEKTVNRLVRTDFQNAYNSQNPGDEPIVFLSAVEAIKAGLSQEQQAECDRRRTLVLSGDPNGLMVCAVLYRLIRDYSAGPGDAKGIIDGERNQVRNDAQLATNLKRRLTWLYPTQQPLTPPVTANPVPPAVPTPVLPSPGNNPQLPAPPQA